MCCEKRVKEIYKDIRTPRSINIKCIFKKCIFITVDLACKKRTSRVLSLPSWRIRIPVDVELDSSASNRLIVGVTWTLYLYIRITRPHLNRLFILIDR